MILTILIIAIIGVIAYFHYAQGFFSATFSAVSAVVAAVIAVSYHEAVITTLLQGKAADYATSMVLCGLFALVYVIFRVIVDKTVPGNIRLPVAIDRVGGAVMGVIAGLFTAGIVALAAAAMPFGPSVGGYARYEVADRDEVTIPASREGGRQRTADIISQLTENNFTPEKKKSLFPAVDDMLLSVVQTLSTGSLSGDRTLQSIHPDYADELFGQRLGVQVGASRTALNLPGKTAQVTVPEPGVFRIDQDLTKNQIDAELNGPHDRPVIWKKDPSDIQLIVRLFFTKDAADNDHILRISTGAVRLCGGGKNFYPIGTLENGKALWSNKLDDFLIVDLKSEDRGVDFVFLIPSDAVSDVLSGDVKTGQKVKQGVFVEAKRLARVDLGDREVKAGVTMPKGQKVQVERKPSIMKDRAEKAKEAGGAGGAATPSPELAPSTDFVYSGTQIAKTLFNPVNVGSPDKDIKSGQNDDGTFSLQSGQFTAMNLKPGRALQILAQGYPISELFEPPGKKVVQIQGSPPAEGGDPWAWGQLSKWKLIDAAGKTYTPAGAFAKVKKQNADRLAASYNSAGTPTDIAAEEGRPTDVWIAFLVPSGTSMKTVTFDNKKVGDVNQDVP